MFKVQTWIIAAIALVLVGGLVLSHRPSVPVFSNSSLTGLATLKQMAAKETVPYGVAFNNQKPTLIEFYADWCTTCQSMASTIQQLHQKYGKRVDFVMVDIDDPQWVAPIQQYHVTGVPQFTLLDAQGKIQQTFLGRVPPSILTEAFAQL